MKLEYTKNTVRNTFWGIAYRLITIIGPFVIKTLLVNKLGIEYSGLNSLFTSILTVLNLTNLGFSSSIVFTMYQAIVDDDIDAQCAMLNYYRKVYKIVGVIILGLGIGIMPFLPYLVNGGCPDNLNLYCLFTIYLVETVLDYFMFAYVTAIFSAYQRNDITLKISTVRYIIQYILQMLILIFIPNYYMYLCILPLMIVFNNLLNYSASKKIYPNLHCIGTIADSTKKEIHIRVGTLFGHKIGNTILVNIDSILISAFLGLTIMGIYGNYYYILTAVNAIVEIFTNSIIAGLGNKLIIESSEKNYRLFNLLTYSWMFIIGTAAACMLSLYQPFIAGIWYDSSFLLSDNLVILIVIYFYAWMFRIMQLTYRDAAGLWTKDWLKPYIAMSINLIASIVLIQITDDISGVLLPTIFVFFFIYFPWEAWVLFKYLFNEKLSCYIKKSIYYTCINILSCALSYLICNTVLPDYTMRSFILRFPIIIFSTCIIWYLFTHHFCEFQEILEYSKKLINTKHKYIF